VRQFAGKIVAETSNLTRVVTDFLKFARPQEFEPEEVAVRPLIEECAEECGLVPDLSALPAATTLIGDRTALRQAFANLLRNSVEAAPGAPPKVSVAAAGDGSTLRLTFRDDGPGIPAEHLAHVFIPFFTTKPQGTGLGLALVQRIVNDHGGTVQVASSPQGAVFTLSFPMRNRVQTTLSAR
jgi:signal transduction histidine kinase